MKNRILKNGKLNRNNTSEGTTLEKQIELAKSNKEDMPKEVDLLFTEKKDGVIPSTNIRTDRQEVALDAIDKIHKSAQNRRDAMNKTKEEEETTESSQQEAPK